MTIFPHHTASSLIQLVTNITYMIVKLITYLITYDILTNNDIIKLMFIILYI